MKRLLVFFVPVLFIACKKQKTESTLPTPTATPTPVLKVDKTILAFSNDTSMKGYIAVEANINWIATTSASWVSLTQASGSSNGTFEVSAKDINPNNTDRTATVMVSPLGNASVQPIVITVSQKSIIPSIIWSMQYGGSMYDDAHYLLPTADGGYLLVGSTYSIDGDLTSNHGDRDGMVIKIDANGNKMWSRSFGGTKTDQFLSAVPSTDGGYVLCGVTQSTDGDISPSDFHGDQDAWFVKIDGSGNKRWSKAFGGSAYEYMAGITTTADGGYLAVGTAVSNNGDITGSLGSNDGWLLKLDANGNKVWSKVHGGTSSDLFFAITKATGGGYLLAGGSYSGGDLGVAHGNSDLWIMKVDESGNRLWSKLYGTFENDGTYSPTSLLATSDGGCVVAAVAGGSGGDVSSNAGGNDAWVLRLDGNGSKVWSKTFGGLATDGAYCILPTLNNGFLALMNTRSNEGDFVGSHGPTDGVLMQLDARGTRVWSKVLGGSSEDFFEHMIPMSDGSIVITGQSYSNDGDMVGNHGGNDAFLMKLKAP